MAITPEERAEWMEAMRIAVTGADLLGKHYALEEMPVYRLINALEAAERQRDMATEVVENIQGKVAMYAGKFETLAAKVQDMRTAQKDYFRTRHQEALTLGKKLEREVDELLKGRLV